jgi:hypothetical protein
VRHTLSELGEAGSSTASAAAWISFLPTGLLYGLSLLAIRPHLPADEDNGQGLFFLSLVGAGYALSAFFPCDAGAPSVGSFRNGVHNLSAVVEYLGALGGFDLLRRSLEGIEGVSHLATAAHVAFVGVIVTFIGVVAPHPARGLVQRIGEVGIFGWPVLAGWTVYLGAG